MILKHDLPERDVFSAGSTVERWNYVEWGWATVLGVTYSLGEWVALNILNLVVISLITALMLWRGRRHGGRWFEVLATAGFVLALLMPGFQPTPGLAALVLFLMALLLTEAHRLWPMVFLGAVTMAWASSHPAFLLPILAPLARIIRPAPNRDYRQTKPPTAYLVVVIMICLACALISPHSVFIIRSSVTALTTTVAANFQTASDTWLTSWTILRLLGAIVLALLIAVSRRETRAWEMIVAAALLGCTVISPSALNFLLVYLAAPASVGLSRLMEPTWAIMRARYAAGSAVVLANVAVAALVLSFCRITPDAFGKGLRPDVFPETATGRLASLPLRAAVLNPPDVGGYVAWRLWPSWKICIDSRPTLYTAGFREEYEKLWQGGQGWREMLNLWRVHAVLGTTDILEHYPNSNLFNRLAESPEWAPVYWDSESILYLKSNIDLASTNLQHYRELKPGIAWPAMEARMKTPEQWADLAADLRRVLGEDPTNLVAKEFLRRASLHTPK